MSTLSPTNPKSCPPRIVEYIQKSLKRVELKPPSTTPDHLEALEKVKTEGWDLPLYTALRVDKTQVQEFIERIKKDGEKVVSFCVNVHRIASTTKTENSSHPRS